MTIYYVNVMSTHAFISDPLLDHYLHVPLENSGILVTAGLIIGGILIIYILFVKERHLYQNGL